MPRPPKPKSAHLQDLEAVFDRHARRFSPFDVLGLRSGEDAAAAPPAEEAAAQDQDTAMGVGGPHPHVVPTPRVAPIPAEPELADAVSVDTTHSHETPTPMSVYGHVLDTESASSDSPVVSADSMSAYSHGGGIHPPCGPPALPVTESADRSVHDLVAAAHLRARLGQKARQVLHYLNGARSSERPAYTVPVGYAQISANTDVHLHYLRRDVLPRLAMLGLIGIAHKSLQGTIYHLYYDAAFLQSVAGIDDAPLTPPPSAGVETLALQRARHERDQAMHEKALAEEALQARQDAARARFLAGLADAQWQWLKQAAKQRVDGQPGSQLLASRYPLYKAAEAELIAEWMDRTAYGESVPHAGPAGPE